MFWHKTTKTTKIPPVGFTRFWQHHVETIWKKWRFWRFWRTGHFLTFLVVFDPFLTLFWPHFEWFLASFGSSGSSHMVLTRVWTGFVRNARFYRFPAISGHFRISDKSLPILTRAWTSFARNTSFLPHWPKNGTRCFHRICTNAHNVRSHPEISGNQYP